MSIKQVKILCISLAIFVTMVVIGDKIYNSNKEDVNTGQAQIQVYAEA